MNLRRLKEMDAPLMLEWMQDPYVVGDLQTRFVIKTLEDCRDFIKAAEDTTHNLHFAIVDETDTYMGTVSLKNIRDDTAEFAIVVRKCAMGKGYSGYGMKEILRIGFRELELSSIYWCVNPNNCRAVRFYDKNGYQKVHASALKYLEEKYSPEQIQSYIWYQETKK